MTDMNMFAVSISVKTQVLMLTMHESEEYFLQALCMGAAGYVVKNAAPTLWKSSACTILRTLCALPRAPD
jgi:DNA-binding NarL/FixJ family response regulator